MNDPILVGDCRLVLPEAFVADVMVVDPPYRAHVHDNATSQDQHTDGHVRHNDFGFASLTEELRTWICQLAAKTKRWSLIYTDVESVAKWKSELEVAGATYIRTLPWVRWSMPCLAGDRPPQGFECIVVAYGSAKGRKRWNGAGNLTHLAHVFAELDWEKPDDLLAHLGDLAEHSDWDEIGNLTRMAHLALRGKDKFKTEKPLDQLLDLVSWFSDRDEIVVDPCSGSGTTGLACKILGRKFVGCELNAEWWEKSNARIRSCNPGDLPGSLSPRDGERFLRWVVTSEKEKGDTKGRKENTDRVRKRMDDKKRAIGAPVELLSPVPSQRTCDHMAGENAELCVICGGYIPQGSDAFKQAEPMSDRSIVMTLARLGAENAEGIRLAAQLLGVPACPKCDFVMRPGHVCKTTEKIMMIPQTWTQAYQRCLDDLTPSAPCDVCGAPVQAGRGCEERHPSDAKHCGSTSCLLRPLQTDERETACGCGCSSCSDLSKHMRPPPGGGRVDGAGAPEPATPPTATARSHGTSTDQRPPLTSAAERTVPLFPAEGQLGGHFPFNDEYTAKKWREAYERALLELAPPLSPTLRARVAARLAAEKIDTTLLAASSAQIDAAVAAMPNGADAAMRALTDPDFIAPPKDDSESGFTHPNGTLITTHGVIPAHVLAELGMHPSLVDEPVRNRALVRARHEKWPGDWNVLQEKAPTGFFARVLKEMQMAPGERLAVLVEAMRERGLQVSAFDVAGWSPIQRNSARLWVQQNSERPTFFDQYANGEAGILGSCTACERKDERAYTHTCEKGQGLGKDNEPPKTTWAPIPTAAAGAESKRGKGRPPGSKNKAPKPWKQAYERVMAELAPSS